MSLPVVTCPSCSATLSLDALLGHQGARDALLALANLHASNARLQMTALRYCGLFAPAKQVMRLDRIATLLEELGALFRAGRVEHRGRSWPAPLDYWITGMEDMLAKRDTLTLPLKSHGYLKTIVANYGDRAEAQAERSTEAQRAGQTPIGAAALPTAGAPAAQSEPPRRMPEHMRAELSKFSSRRADQSSTTEDSE